MRKNYDEYWRDVAALSNPEKGKYVRNAKGTSLGKLLKMINQKILAPHDKILPDVIFGGVSGKSNITAVRHLLGKRRRRVLLKADITTFFEQISEERVYHFFRDKCKCSPKAAKLIAGLCCVPVGPKGSGDSRKTIGRGFATSQRLAIWCNLDLFIRLEWLVKKRLRGKDPRIAIFVDDIGINASGVTKKEMDALYVEVKDMLENRDPNQSLPLNDGKKEIVSHEETPEHLGLRMYRNKTAIGKKTRSGLDRVKEQLRGWLKPKQRKMLKKRRGAIYRYVKHVQKSNSELDG